ncbi:MULTISPECIES: hypothetical protein [unclassified Bradyrhizobium]|uniref:hypothetical protein n=1 Tax=unclassified Bradyrhizobium TaxID=2631580 RepID=UPI0028EA8E0A|nr:MULTISPECIES: hypothetical protein [unclassified Bradyrhizobium]
MRTSALNVPQCFGARQRTAREHASTIPVAAPAEWATMWRLFLQRSVRFSSRAVTAPKTEKAFPMDTVASALRRIIGDKPATVQPDLKLVG